MKVLFLIGFLSGLAYAGLSEIRCKETTSFDYLTDKTECYSPDEKVVGVIKTVSGEINIKCARSNVLCKPVYDFPNIGTSINKNEVCECEDGYLAVCDRVTRVGVCKINNCSCPVPD